MASNHHFHLPSPNVEYEFGSGSSSSNKKEFGEDMSHNEHMYNMHEPNIRGESDSDTEVDGDSTQYRKPNTILNQDSDEEFVRLTLKIPGLKCKRQLNFTLSKAPKNGRIVECKIKNNKLKLIFVINEVKTDKKIFRYRSAKLKGPVEEHGSYIKFDDDKILWCVHKTQKW